MIASLKLRRCAQCWTFKAHPSFNGARGRPVKMCGACRALYRGWAKKSAEERAAVDRKGVPASGGSHRVVFVRSSGSAKLGGIPVSLTERGSCPTSCGLYSVGCYALYGKLAHHWRGVPDRGLSWGEFCARVAALPELVLWRHNEAGDLPGDGDALDVAALEQLVDANARAGARGFTFTHKPLGAAGEALAVRRANEQGFTINLSADTLEQADALAELRVGPVVVTVPHDAPERLRTPAGRRVTVCLAQTRGLTCAECRLCAHPTRIGIIGFRAHGQAAGLIDAARLTAARKEVG